MTTNLKWEALFNRQPETPEQTDEIVGWKLEGKYLTLRVLQDKEGLWYGYFDNQSEAATALESTTHVSAKREFLKMTLRRARAVAAELELAWVKLGQTTLKEQTDIEAAIKKGQENVKALRQTQGPGKGRY